MPSKKSNIEQIHLLKKGDMLAFDAIYEQYCKRLYGFVLLYIKQETDAEEIVQEVFLKIWKKRKGIDGFSSFDAFIFTLAYNTTIDLLRKRVHEKKYLEHLQMRQQISTGEEIIDEIHFKEINNRVNALIDQLPPRQKEIFRLSREEGLTHAEIAQKLSISPNTVKNHLVKTLAHLKKHIDISLMTNVLFFFLFI